MKLFLTILLLLPSYIFAQDITGIWTGTLTTSEKKLPYELVISDSAGRLGGYSHITFTVKGQELVAVKTIIVTNDNGEITVEDEDMVSNNIVEAQAKRIKQIDNLVLHIQDSTMMLIGTFKTKKITGMRQGTGEIMLQKRKLSDSSKLMAKLNELDLSNSLSFLQLKKETGKIVSEPIAVKPTAPVNNNLASRNIMPAAPVIAPRPIVKDTPVITAKEPAIIKPVITPPKPKVVTAAVVAPKPTAVVKEPVAVAPPKPKVVAVTPVKKVVPTQTVVVAKQTTANKVAVAVAPPPKPVVAAPPIPKVQPKPENIPSGAAADIANRQIETIQTLTIESDSILITLYDNGYVDGDTVSVLLNGKVIMGKVGLSTKPVTKMVYVTPDLGDSLQFVMYAENLGSIPPNTGLMILQDGKKRYEIFFSGDLQKNAAITLRKKKPGLIN